MKYINENLLMRTLKSNRLLQLTSALAKIGAAFKAAFSYAINEVVEQTYIYIVAVFIENEELNLKP
ncbi:hypothetical protein PSKAS_36250 [Peribacillus sp. N1]